MKTISFSMFALLLCFVALDVSVQTKIEPLTNGETNLTSRPQSTENKPSNTASTLLKQSKVIFVRSNSALVGESVIEEKLQARKEFAELGLMITRDINAADVILEVHHDRFTKYVFTAVHPSTNILLASGKLSSLGGTVAGKVAERFLKQVRLARQQ
jgi:hypothetical protein